MGAFHLDNPLAFQVLLFSLIGVTSMLASWCYAVRRAGRPGLGAGMLAFGFLLWGLYLIAFPFFQAAEQLSAVFLISTVLHLFIAISMIVLVLEEEAAVAQDASRVADEQELETQLIRTRALTTEKRFRHLFEQANEAIVVVSAMDFSIVELNEKARALFGVGELGADRVLLGRCLDVKLPEPPPVTGADWFDLLARLESVNVRRRDGHVTETVVDGSEIRLEDRPAYQFVFRDRTEKVRLEQQLRQAEKLSALGQMISGVAHELNNPLTAVKGYLELILARHELTDRTRADLEKVAVESERAAKLVTQFLHFARERKPRREMCDLNQIVRRVIELREFEFKVAMVAAKLDLEEGLPMTLLDSDQVQQVLLNLINNALHAMVETPPPHALTIRSRSGNEVLTLEIEDNGPGIPEDRAAHIFEPFYTTKEVGTGTGLGLSIAHGVMTDHDGEIEARNVKGGGALFVLRFPFREAGDRDETTRIIMRPEITDDTPPGAPAEILVLDDETAISGMMGEMIEMLGHRPILCNAARQALEIIREKEIDVILSDFRMPGMNGEDFYAEVREFDPDLAARIIFISGDVANEETQDFIRSTGNATIAKPFKIDGLREALNANFNKGAVDG